jgi:hypothetical protein
MVRLTWSLLKNIPFHSENYKENLPQSAARDSEPVLIFLHVPKTGGSYIRTILNYWCIATRKYCFAPIQETSYNVLLKAQRMN